MNYTLFFNKLRVITSVFFNLEYLQQREVEAKWALPYLKKVVLDPFESQDVPEQAETFLDAIEAARLGFSDIKSALNTTFDAVITDSQYEARIADSSSFFSLLSLDMNANDETIRKRHLEIASENVDTDGSIKAPNSNSGTGKLIYTFNDLEIAAEDQLQCICTTSTAARSTFELSGGPAELATSFEEQGAGFGTTLSPLYERGLTNGTFEAWTGTPDEADEWTAITGEWGTDMKKGTDVYSGTYALESVNDQADWRIYQSITLVPDEVYAFGCWVRKATGASGHIYVEICDTDNIQQVDDELDINLSDLAEADTWYFKYFTFTAPKTAAASWRLIVRADTHTTAAASLDNMQLGAMTEFNHMFFALFEGDEPFGIGDKFGYYSATTGFDVQVSAVGDPQTATGDSDQDTIVLTGDHAADFPVGASVQNSTDKTWHRITSSEYDTVTTIEVTPKAFTPWNGLVVRAFYHGRVQELIGRLYGEQLPSDDSPSQEDP